jgi:hypothetical protein
MEELTGDDGSETEALPGSRDDQTHLGHVIAPSVALELEGPVADNLIAVHHHDPLGSLGVEFCGASFNEFAPRDISAEIDPVLRG